MFLLIISTLMIPPTIILVPNFLVISELGLLNSLWGVIWPAVATPTGVFLLRQYMLTIPDELIDAARMDHASEWRIFWRIVLPLSAPALAVLAIFSVMWRWNDFLWPLIVLSRTENFTLQLALNAFQGELTTQWHYLLAMTVITLLPVTLVFAFLQKHITHRHCVRRRQVDRAPHSGSALELVNVVKRFGATHGDPRRRPRVADGEFVVFVGPSGCGKSTLLRMICGARGGDRRRAADRRQAASTTSRRRSAASRWCSSPTRSIRT